MLQMGGFITQAKVVFGRWADSAEAWIFSESDLNSDGAGDSPPAYKYYFIGITRHTFPWA